MAGVEAPRLAGVEAPKRWLHRLPFGGTTVALTLLVALGGGLTDWRYREEHSQPVVVVALHSFPAYARVAEMDVTVAHMYRPKGAVTEVTDAENKVTLHPLPAGVPITSSDLVKLPMGDVVMSIPAVPDQPFGAGESVTLIGLVKNSPVSTVVSETATVLGTEGEQLVVGLTRAEALLLGGYLHPDRGVVIVRNLQ